MAMGISFLPGGQDDDDPLKKGQSAADRYQTAIKILSLRLPRFVGQGAIAPAPLLNASGSQGQRQMVMGGQPVQQAFAQMAGLPSQTTPNVPFGSLPGMVSPNASQAPRIIPGLGSTPPPPPPAPPPIPTPITREWNQPQPPPAPPAAPALTEEELLRRKGDKGGAYGDPYVYGVI